MQRIKILIYNTLFSRLRSKNTPKDKIVRIRYWLLKNSFMSIGNNCNIQQGVKFRTPKI